MTQLLFNLYNFHEDWAYAYVAPYIQPNMTVTILPFSFAESQITAENWSRFYGIDGSYYKEIVAPFTAYGIPKSAIVFVNYFTASPESLAQQIDNSDILFLTGGLPDKTMIRLENLQVVQALETFSGLLIGSSAGAMVQLKQYHISPDADYPTFSYQKGLALITNFALEVHFEDSPAQRASIKRVLAETGVPLLYAMENQGGLLVENGTVTPMGLVQQYRLDDKT